MSKENKNINIEEDEVVAVIRKSKNYEKFKFIDSNRSINSLNLNKLIGSMKEEQLISPICVNENFEIIDGQHRVKAEESLNLPVYYYVSEGYSFDQMRRANLVGVTWKKDDFLKAYTEEGNPNYVTFDLIRNTYEINTTDLIKVLSKIKTVSFSDLSIIFEKGNLEITDEEEKSVESFLEALKDFKFFKDYRKSKFVSAFLELYFYPLYKHEIMRERLKKRSAVLTYQLNKDLYLEILANKIYSYGSNGKTIYYDIVRKKFYS